MAKVISVKEAADLFVDGDIILGAWRRVIPVIWSTFTRRAASRQDVLLMKAC
jgi:hypothetical protein